MTKHLAVEWGEKGIRLMCVAPGPIADTEGFSRLGKFIILSYHVHFCKFLDQFCSLSHYFMEERKLDNLDKAFVKCIFIII